jgi:uncharacterized protein YciI
MPLFVLTRIDRPGALEKRVQNRPAHLDYVRSHPGVKAAGALLSEAEEMAGSLFIIEAQDVKAVEAFVAGDPFTLADIYERTEIRPFRLAVGSVG